MTEHFVELGKKIKTMKPQSIRLTPREEEVKAEILLGLTNKQIADKLFICEKTVKAHITSIFQKQGFKSRSQLIVKCLKENK